MPYNIVLLCGGEGSRVKELLPGKFPKQFFKENQKYSLFQKTVLRHKFLSGRFLFFTNQEYEKVLKQQLEEIQIYEYGLVLESTQTNTFFPVILASFLTDFERSIVLPCDQEIDDIGNYEESIRVALNAPLDKISIIGTPASFPSTQFGYIQTINETFHSFKEKPELEQAKEFLKKGDHFFNTGIFCFSNQELQRISRDFFPEVLDKASKISAEFQENYLFIQSESLHNIPRISFDHAVLEKTKSIHMTQGSFSWTDIGSPKEIAKLLSKDTSQQK